MRPTERALLECIGLAVIRISQHLGQPTDLLLSAVEALQKEDDETNKAAFTGFRVAGEAVTVDELKLFHGRTLDEACTEIIAQRAAKRDARDAREGEQTFPRTGAGGQA